MKSILSSLLQSWRFAAGLHWVGTYPPFPWRSFFVVAACAATYGFVCYADNLDERVLVMEKNWSRQFADCLNGDWRGTAADGTQIACMPAETYHPGRGS